MPSINGHTLPTAAPTVLLVDDEPTNLHILSRLLVPAGYRTLSAETGEQGRRLAARHKPDIILLDIMMPDENGFETCEMLKASPVTTDIPVIFLSALATSEDKVRAFDLGAVDYITKPFDRSEILARLRLHLKLKRALTSLLDEQAAKLRQIAEDEAAPLQSGDPPKTKFALRGPSVSERGGNFHEVFALSEDTCCYFLAHMNGRAPCPATLQALVRQNAGPLYTPLETLKTINAVLSRITVDAQVTAQFCQLDRRREQIVLVSAGHPPPLLVPREGEVRFLYAEGDALGLFDAVFLKPLNLRVAAGDRLYFYSDGRAEKPDGQSPRLGRPLMAKAAAEHRDMPLEQAVDALFQAMGQSNGARQDNLVLMGVEV